MIVVSIIVIVIILALVIVYVTHPLFTLQDETIRGAPEDAAERTFAEYNAILERIRELDFDFNLGKMTVEEHNAQREEFLSQAAILRRQLQADDSASVAATA